MLNAEQNDLDNQDKVLSKIIGNTCNDNTNNEEEDISVGCIEHEEEKKGTQNNESQSCNAEEMSN